MAFEEARETSEQARPGQAEEKNSPCRWQLYRQVVHSPQGFLLEDWSPWGCIFCPWDSKGLAPRRHLAVLRGPHLIGLRPPGEGPEVSLGTRGAETLHPRAPSPSLNFSQHQRPGGRPSHRCCILRLPNSQTADDHHTFLS